MGSIQTPPTNGVQLPTIKLDYTLSELYRRACPEAANVRFGWVPCGITSTVDLTQDVARNTKYVYVDQILVKTASHELRNGNPKLRCSLAKKYLGHIAQRDAFVSGRAPVVFFHMGRTPGEMEHDRREAEATLSVLDPSQRPELIFCPGPSDIPLAEHGIDKLLYKLAVDELETLPLTHPLEAHWWLNSKAALARSGLPTPRCDIIETECPPPVPPEECCGLCAETAAIAAAASVSSGHRPLPTIPRGCSGPRRRWLDAQAERVAAAVRAWPVPFVFKTQQSFGGAGTWLVKTEAQRAQLLEDLLASPDDDVHDVEASDGETRKGWGFLGKLLPLLTPENAHLSPTAVLLTDLVADPRADYGLTFVGRQDELRAKFAPLMARIAAWVAERGYAGPVGADVLESSSSNDDDDDGGGEHFVVDLNVRACGSISLPLLRGHFVSRGLDYASSFSVTVRGGRAEFMDRWRVPLEEGRMLILSWWEDREADESIADVVVGAEDEPALAEWMKRIREGTEEVTF
ncbi:hypothetical protein C7999DRAFT_42507 [Corynascus novoguineensis]|uniref:ATP-grasp domain-containing protein n=1 Tax=Corynascus novoguineensis TaxID=1126955 RepID=A0AAN7CPT0_9PEZI|nr:hypothetical protein C7999DRAFT_42507 [Corynascus novoguineensis]